MKAFNIKNLMNTVIAAPLSVTLAITLASTLLTGCNSRDNASSGPVDVPTLALEIPDSLTGGTAGEPAARTAASDGSALRVSAAGTGEPCSYLGSDEDDPFRNGYETSKFMVSAMATWTCISDTLIDIAAYVPHNGQIIETDNDTNADDFKADEPTHYSVTDDSDSQTTIRLYYNYNRSNPPVSGEAGQLYISWNTDSDGNVTGRLIVDGDGINWKNHDSEDPRMMRMDFDYSAQQKVADMYLMFDNDNPWADAFRIKMVKDLDANPLTQVFEARGLIVAKAQFSPVESITETPNVQLYTVSDALGNGASIAEFQDLSLPLELNADTGNDLGDYLFTKKDIYFFEDDMDWDYIYKTVTSSAYRGNRTTPASGGSWLPFDPSQDMIISALGLDGDYFTNDKCENIDDDCNDLLNAIFVDGFAGQEENQGSDPMDWRSDAINTADYLTTAYPNGVDWTDAFVQQFTP